MVDQSPNVLLVGNAEAAELFSVSRFVHKDIGHEKVQQHDDISSAIHAIKTTQWFPDLVVVLQQWPDEYAAADVQRFISFIPLARWVCCFSSWCEGDGRNRNTWPLSMRISARTAEPRIRAELEVVTGKRPAVPLTASRDESFEFDALGPFLQADSLIAIQVISPDNELAAWLVEMLNLANYDATQRTSAIPPSAVLWDTDPWQAEIAVAMRQFSRQNPETPILALANTATPQETESIKASGATTVVAKLSTCSAILEALRNALSARRAEGVTLR